MKPPVLHFALSSFFICKGLSNLYPHRAASISNSPLELPTAPATAPNFSYEELFALQKKFLDNFIAPNNALQAKSINSSLLAANVQGRVDITRTFDGPELNTEYLFGLFANLATTPREFTLLGIPTAYEITHFAAHGNIVSASIRFAFFFQVLNITIPIQIQTWNAYNAAGQISMYDATFTGWWQWAVSFLLNSAAAKKGISLAATTAYVTRELASSICSSAMTYCTGTDAQYISKAHCKNFLTKEVRLGEAYELGRNTLLCRMVHQNMVPSRPSVHCPHIGPSGGRYCVDEPSYIETVSQNYFSNFPFAAGNGTLTG